MNNYYNFALFYFLCCVYSVNCNLNKHSGDDCEWEGVKGKCVNADHCFTTLDETNPRQPACTEYGWAGPICCTDCELVNNTRNAVFSPTFGVYWKTGQKAWDKCLDYLIQVPHKCHSSYYARIVRKLDEVKKCHVYDLWGVGAAESGNVRHTYPHMALLGYGDTLEAAEWLCGGSIISEKYILTVAHCINNHPNGKNIKFAAFGDLDRSKPVQAWRHVAVERVIPHPEYRPPSMYHDIALIETKSPITFDKKVWPACLHFSEASYDGEAVSTTWKDPEGEYSKIANTPFTLYLKKYGKTECDASYTESGTLPQGFNDSMQLCYGVRDPGQDGCKGSSGEPLLITTHDLSCFDTIIGLRSFSRKCGGSAGYDLYTKVINYVPWIESVVWP